MAKQVSRHDIFKSILKGIQDSRRMHRQISHRRFGDAPEYWVSSIVARRLAKTARGCAVELETSVRDVMKAAGARALGRPHRSLRIDGRFDIVLWWKAKKAPRALIELKHPVRAATVPAVIEDAKRVMRALKTGEANLLDMGCLAFYCHSSPTGGRKRSSAREEINDVLKNLRKQVAQLDEDRSLKVLLSEEQRLFEDKNARGNELRYGKACCITIRRNRRASEV